MPKKKKSEEYNAQLAAILRQGEKSEFWQAIVKVLNDNIKWIVDVILNDDTYEGNNLNEVITLTRRDFIRKWREYQMELLDIPEMVAKKLEKQDDDSPSIDMPGPISPQ